MTNGNDLIEFEENNINNLDEKFFEKYKDKFLEFCLEDESICDKFRKYTAKEWNKFVEEEFNNRGI